MKTFAMMVLGCKVNDYEATYLKNKLLDVYEEKSFKDMADIYVIFTCCVTNVAEAKTRKMIRHARKLNKDAYIVTIGCLCQTKPNDDVFNEVDLIIGSKDKDKAFDYIKERLIKKEITDLNNTQFEELYLDKYPGKSRAYLKVQDGCNQFCSYCIIPYARGRERSANHLKLLKQAEILSTDFNELVLTGIHTGRYNDGEFNLYNLLSELNKIENLKTIRLSSIEITEITDEIIELIKKSKKLAHHLHIPVQSCSNEILSLMNRPYTIEEFYERVNYIRQEIPDISISTDLIVGFPNETDELFNITLENLKKISFSFVHVFPYARKTGTKADKLEGHMNNSIKKERVEAVIELQKTITKQFNASFVGKKLQMLVEKSDDLYIYGYVKQYFYVKVKGNAPVGDVIDIIIDEVNDEVIGHVA